MSADPAGRGKRPGLKAAALAAAAVVGAVAGGIAGAAGWVDLAGDESRRPGPATVAIYACPGEQPTGTLHRGDRVFATGVDGSGEWLQVRDPFNLDARVWLQAELVVPDESFDDLPVASSRCKTPRAAPSATAKPPATHGATDTASPAPVSTATTPAITAAASPTQTPPGTPQPTPTPVPDTSGPAMTGLAADPASIREDTDGSSCSPAWPRITTVSVNVSDPSGVKDVTVSWAYEAVSGAEKLTAGAGTSYSTDLSFIVSQTRDIVLTVKARDFLGNSTTQTTTVNVRNCP